MALPASRVGVASDQVDFEGKIIGGGGGGAVSSVNGKTGTVVLTATDVHALPDTTEIPVQSVNGQTGEVVLSASDVSALPDTTTIPSTAEDLTFNVQTEYSEGTVGKELSALNNSLSTLQPKTDNTLTTTSKTVVGGINEVKTSVNSLLNKFDITGTAKLKASAGQTSDSLGISSTYGGYYYTLLIGSTSEGVQLAFGYFGSSAVGHIFIKSYANKSETTSGWVLIK